MTTTKHFKSRNAQFAYLMSLAGYYQRALYVGAHKNKKPPARLSELKTVADAVDCLEIFEPNVRFLQTTSWFHRVHLGDIRDWYCTDYDLIYWHHGPEHVERCFLPELLQRLRGLAPAVWLACPWGHRKQDTWRGNKHEQHVSHLLPEDFPGYTVTTSGECNKKKSQILAWYDVNTQDQEP